MVVKQIAVNMWRTLSSFYGVRSIIMPQLSSRLLLPFHLHKYEDIKYLCLRGSNYYRIHSSNRKYIAGNKYHPNVVPPTDTMYCIQSCSSSDSLLEFMSCYGNTLTDQLYAYSLIQLHSLCNGGGNKRGHGDVTPYRHRRTIKLANYNPRFKVCVEQLHDRVCEFQPKPLLTVLNMLRCLGVSDCDPTIRAILHRLASIDCITEFELRDVAFGMLSLAQLSTADGEMHRLVKELLTMMCSEIDRILLSVDKLANNPLITLDPILLTGITSCIKDLSNHSQAMLLEVITYRAAIFTPPQANMVLKSLKDNRCEDEIALYSALAKPVLEHLNTSLQMRKPFLMTLITYYHYITDDMQNKLSNAILEKLPLELSLKSLMRVVRHINQNRVLIRGQDKVISNLLAMHFRSNTELEFDLLCLMTRLLNNFDTEMQESVLSTVTDNLANCSPAGIRTLYSAMERGGNIHPMLVAASVKQLLEHFSKHDISNVENFTPLLINVNRLDIRARQRLIIHVLQQCHNMSADNALHFLIALQQGMIKDSILPEALCGVFSGIHVRKLSVKHLAIMLSYLTYYPDSTRLSVMSELKRRIVMSGKDSLTVLINYKSSCVADDELRDLLLDSIRLRCHELRLSELMGFAWALMDLDYITPQISTTILERLEDVIKLTLDVEELLLCLDILWCVCRVPAVVESMGDHWQDVYKRVVRDLESKLDEDDLLIDNIKFNYLPHLLQKIVVIDNDTIFETFELLSAKFRNPYFHSEQVLACIVSLHLAMNLQINLPFNDLAMNSDVEAKNTLIMDIIDKGISSLQSDFRKDDITSMVHSNYIYVHHCLKAFPQYDTDVTNDICNKFTQLASTEQPGADSALDINSCA